MFRLLQILSLLLVFVFQLQIPAEPQGAGETPPFSSNLSDEIEKAQKYLQQGDKASARSHLQITVGKLTATTDPGQRVKCFTICHGAGFHDLDGLVFNSFKDLDAIPPDVLLERITCLQNCELECSLELLSVKKFLNSPKTLRYRFTRSALDAAYRLLLRKKYDQCEKLCRAVKAVDPKWAHPYFIHGMALHEQGKQNAAILLVQQALKLAKEDGQSESDRPGYHHALGSYLMESGKPDEALFHCRQAHLLAPGQIPFLEQLYGICMRTKSDDALVAADKLLDLASSPEGKARCLHLKALYYEQANRLPDTEVFCRQALALNPSSLDSTLTLITTLTRQNRQKEARALADQYYLKYGAGLLAPEVERLALHLGHPALAATYWRRAHLLAPRDRRYLDCLISALILSKPAQDAFSEIGKLMTLSSSNKDRSRCYELKGQAYLRQNMLPQAETAFRQSAKLDPANLGPILGMMSIMYRKGQADPAAALAEEYYNRNKNQLSAGDLERIASHLEAAADLTADTIKFWERFGKANSSLQDIHASIIYRLIADRHDYCKAVEIFRQATAGMNGPNELANKILQKIPDRKTWECYAVATLTLCLLEHETGASRQDLTTLRSRSCQLFEAAIATRSISINKRIIEFIEDLAGCAVTTPLLCRQLILTYASCDELRTALGKANQFVIKFPANEDLRVLRAGLQMRMGNEKALADLHLRTQRRQYSIEDLRAVRLQWEPYIVREKLFDRIWSKKCEETDKHFAREQQYYLSKVSQAGSGTERKRLLYLAARMAIAREQFTEALAILSRVEALDSTGYELQAWSLQLLDRSEEATQCRQKVVQLWRQEKKTDPAEVLRPRDGF